MRLSGWFASCLLALAVWVLLIAALYFAFSWMAVQVTL